MTKLFKIWQSDGNDRWQTMSIKANDIENVVEWLQQTQFKPEALDKLTVDIQGDTNAYIMWEECEDCPDNETDECDLCEQSTHYFEITEEENPEPNDYQFKTIYGTNEYYDLTVQPPTKAEDWDKELSAAWRENPQKGCDLLTKKTLESIAQRKRLPE